MSIVKFRLMMADKVAGTVKVSELSRINKEELLDEAQTKMYEAAESLERLLRPFGQVDSIWVERVEVILRVTPGN